MYCSCILGRASYLAPFSALIQRSQQLKQGLTGDLEDILPADLMDFCECCNGICNNHGVAVCQQVLQAACQVS